MELTTIFSAIASICYTLATITIISRLFHPVGPNKKAVIALALIATTTHFLSVTYSVFNQGEVNFSLPNVISLVSLIISAGMTSTAFKQKASLILPVVYGFSAILQFVLILMPNVEHLPIDPSKLVLVTHISLALVAYCVLVIATLYAFQVAFINYKLKQKNLEAVNHLPPLLQVEGQLFVILAAGTACLVGSEIVGLLFIDSFFSKDNIHKTLLSVVALAIYLVILWGHYVKGWRGKIIMILTTAATTVLTLSYFGSRFVKEFLL